MTDETLSSFLDGECSPDELDRLLEALARDPALKQRFSRLSLAREVQAGARLERADLGFADRVMAQLEREPAEPAKVVSLRTARRAWAWQPLVGLAAAAGVAAVAVLVLTPDSGTLPVPEVASAKPVLVAPTGEVEPIAAADDRRWQQLDQDSSRQLNGYWVVYSQSRVQQGMGGTLGNARYAAYTAEGQAQDPKR